MFVENAKKVKLMYHNLRNYPKISKITFSNAFAKFKTFLIQSMHYFFRQSQKSITQQFISLYCQYLHQ